MAAPDTCAGHHALQTAQCAPNLALCYCSTHHSVPGNHGGRRGSAGGTAALLLPSALPCSQPPPAILAPVSACGTEFVQSESGTADTPRDIYARVHARQVGGQLLQQTQIWLAIPVIHAPSNSCFLLCQSKARRASAWRMTGTLPSGPALRTCSAPLRRVM